MKRQPKLQRPKLETQTQPIGVNQPKKILTNAAPRDLSGALERLLSRQRLETVDRRIFAKNLGRLFVDAQRIDPKFNARTLFKESYQTTEIFESNYKKRKAFIVLPNDGLLPKKQEFKAHGRAYLDLLTALENRLLPETKNLSSKAHSNHPLLYRLIEGSTLDTPQAHHERFKALHIAELDHRLTSCVDKLVNAVDLHWLQAYLENYKPQTLGRVGHLEGMESQVMTKNYRPADPSSAYDPLIADPETLAYAYTWRKQNGLNAQNVSSNVAPCVSVGTVLTPLSMMEDEIFQCAFEHRVTFSEEDLHNSRSIRAKILTSLARDFANKEGYSENELCNLWEACGGEELHHSPLSFSLDEPGEFYFEEFFQHLTTLGSQAGPGTSFYKMSLKTRLDLEIRYVEEEARFKPFLFWRIDEAEGQFHDRYRAKKAAKKPWLWQMTPDWQRMVVTNLGSYGYATIPNFFIQVAEHHSSDTSSLVFAAFPDHLETGDVAIQITILHVPEEPSTLFDQDTIGLTGLLDEFKTSFCSPEPDFYRLVLKTISEWPYSELNGHRFNWTISGISTRGVVAPHGSIAQAILGNLAYAPPEARIDQLLIEDAQTKQTIIQNHREEEESKYKQAIEASLGD